MSGRNYSLNSNKPVFSMVDDEAMTAAFMSNNSVPYLAADRLPKTSEEVAIEEAETRQKELYQQMRQIEQRTVDSTKRSMGAIIESEKIGIETAQDLIRQREQLGTTETRLDGINHTLKDTQKNINGIKSVFSSLKQWWTTPTKQVEGNNPKTPTTSPTTDIPNENLIPNNAKLRSALQNSQNAPNVSSSDSHPVIRNLYEEEEDEPVEIDEFKSQTKRVNQRLDQDLDFMSEGLGRLKGLALGLGSEITEQNEVIDRIQVKADRADITIHGQNTQIRHILKK